MTTLSLTPAARIPPQLEALTHWSILAMLFSLGFSRALFSMAALTCIVSWLLSGQWAEKVTRLRQNLPALLSLAYIFYALISLMFSPGKPDDIEYALNNLWKMLVIPIIAISIRSQHAAEQCWKAFFWGMLVLLAHIYASLHIKLSWVRQDGFGSAGIFFNPLSQSVGLSIFSAYTLHLLTTGAKDIRQSLFLIIALAAAAYALLVISSQRLGYLTLFVGAMVVVWQNASRHKRIYGAIILIVAAGLLATFNSKIQNRLTLVVQEVGAYDYKPNYTSVGARLHMWYTAWQNIQDQPLLGHGLGSYRLVAERSFEDEAMCNVGCAHPHNQYLYTLLELGFFGLIIFIALLTAIYKNLKDIPPQLLGRVVLLIFLISSLFETLLWYRGWVYLFLPLLGLLAIRTNSGFNHEK